MAIDKLTVQNAEAIKLVYEALEQITARLENIERFLVLDPPPINQPEGNTDVD